MIMRIVSWNINSVRPRLPRLLSLLHRHNPDVVCLQETKVEDNSFPIMQLNSVGYRAITYGQKNYNGVSLLIKDSSVLSNLLVFDTNSHINNSKDDIKEILKPTQVKRGFPGNPIPSETRVISACIGNFRLVNVYVVNGQERKSSKFKLKERWMKALGNWLKSLPQQPPLLIVGDFNVAPDERDVWDPEGLKDRIHCTIEERSWLKNLKGNRLQDLLRIITEESGVYTWWPYQRDAFERDEGLRFDLVLGDKSISDSIHRIWVDRDEREPRHGLPKPSDHAPIIIDLKD